MRLQNQLADAAVKWRRAELKYREANREWCRWVQLHPTGPETDRLTDKKEQRLEMKVGALAKVALLADILIQQGVKK